MTAPKMRPTVFVTTEVPIVGETLWFDGNSKITASGGDFDRPVPNAFSLPAITTCPGSTPACRAACYVAGLRVLSPDTFAKYEHNERTIHALLATEAARSADAVGRWIHGNCVEFRWHISGDVFSHDYADWIVRVCRAARDVDFWIYTRSMWAVPVLRHARNLVINLSADRDNYDAAITTWRQNPGTRVCYMAQDPDPAFLPPLPADSVVFPDYPQRGRALDDPREHPWWQGLDHTRRLQVCGADFFGQSESQRCGVCRKCMVPS